MTKSLTDILAAKWDEPAEIGTIKDFVRSRYNAKVGIKMNNKSIIISAQSAALAGTLRLNMNELQQILKTDKKLIIRIG